MEAPTLSVDPLEEPGRLAAIPVIKTVHQLASPVVIGA
jgi:hypothetical protein